MEPGFSIDEFRALMSNVANLSALPESTRQAEITKAVVAYLSAEPQRVARETEQDQSAPALRIFRFRAEMLEGIATNPKRPGPRDISTLEDLLKAARTEPAAYDLVKPILMDMIQAGKKPTQVLDFIADDWAGLIKPRAPRRRQRPQDWFRQEQIAGCVFALLSVNFSQRQAFAIVADAAQKAGIVWSKTYSKEAVSTENIRGAWRTSTLRNERGWFRSGG